MNLRRLFYFLDESNLHHVELLDTQTNRNQQTNIADILIEKGLAIHTKKQSKKVNMASMTNGEQVRLHFDIEQLYKCSLSKKTEFYENIMYVLDTFVIRTREDHILVHPIILVRATF